MLFRGYSFVFDSVCRAGTPRLFGRRCVWGSIYRGIKCSGGKNGSFKGLRARHGFDVDAEWSNGKLVSATVYSLNGAPLRLVYGKTVLDRKIGKGKKFVFRPEDKVQGLRQIKEIKL